MDGDAVPGMPDLLHGPVGRDHGEHLAVAREHVHGERGHTAIMDGGDQCAHQGGANALALPGIGHHDADVRYRGGPLAKGRIKTAGVRERGGAGRHRVPDDDAVPGGDHGVDELAVAAQQPEQGRARRHRREESQVARPH
jgi:hypothetical protein